VVVEARIREVPETGNLAGLEAGVLIQAAALPRPEVQGQRVKAIVAQRVRENLQKLKPEAVEVPGMPGELLLGLISLMPKEALV
jgi:hypothetical protein